MTEIEVKQWPIWRVNRLLRMMQYKAKGLTDQKVSEKTDMPSVATVSRELNSPQALEIGRKMVDRATGMIWPLIEKQILQIETDLDLKSGARLTFRGGLINSLLKLVPQRIEAELKQEVQVDVRQWDIAEIFAEYGETILGDALRRQLQADRRHTEATVSEPVDPETE